jgi:pyruvate/2-oxoglutarate dehydrogenase complex dihydrolipoamide dehydrogenase (E3) component
VATDMAGVRRRKRDMVDGLVDIHRKRFAALFRDGHFVATRTIEVRLAAGAMRIEAERVFLDLGTHAIIPDIPGLADAAPLTRVEALELDRLPEHLIVLGGGYVGVEFAQAFRRFGSRVTVVEYGPQLLAREDLDVAEAVRAIFEEDGIDVILGAETHSVEGRSGRPGALLSPDGRGQAGGRRQRRAHGSGRTPNTKDIGLDRAGVKLD